MRHHLKEKGHNTIFEHLALLYFCGFVQLLLPNAHSIVVSISDLHRDGQLPRLDLYGWCILLFTIIFHLERINHNMVIGMVMVMLQDPSEIYIR